MPKLNGTIILKFENVTANNQDELRNAIAWLNPIIATQIIKYEEIYKESDTSVTGKVTDFDQSGISGSVTVTTRGNNGSVSGTISGKSDGTVTGGSVQATWTF
jgi:hypothetical protein